MAYYFTSESVSEGHPDKVADQISDALLDEFLRRDSESKVSCEALVTTGLVFLGGEVKTSAYVDVQETARNVIRNIGYNKGEYMFEANSCGVISTIHRQSLDINQGVECEDVENQGADDQGIMFGYACRDTKEYTPLALTISHIILKELVDIRKEGKMMTYLRPDAKSQVTVEYSDVNKPLRIDTIVISTQHDDFDTDEGMLAKIRKDIINILIPRVLEKLSEDNRKLFYKEYKLLVNPTGKFVVGGPHEDTGLTGRKIIVDTYGGKGAHGGGAFSGKDSSKVDRSAAYAARHIAKNLVAAGVCDECLVQLAYAIGVAEPVGVYINTYGTSHLTITDGEIAKRIDEMFDLRPYAIIQRFGLKNPIFLPTASYGHFGRTPYKQIVKIFDNGVEKEKEVEFFTWEKLDYVDKIKAEFSIL